MMNRFSFSFRVSSSLAFPALSNFETMTLPLCDMANDRNIPSDQTSDAVKQQEMKYPKRKIALLFGYSGSGYHGMQM